jgi:dTDP-4-dehydrorhamnose reductase
MQKKMSNESTVLVLGASGMLGNAVLRCFAESSGYSVVGSVRSRNALELLPQELRGQIICGLEVENVDFLLQLFAGVRPEVVINCIGLVKQLGESGDPLAAIPINSLLPHRLLRLCKLTAARLIHVSTDCVFAGTKGMYCEDDEADARDLYGRSKFLGEVDDPQAVTLRTSIIGPELGGAHGLLGWLLSQRGRAMGYTRAIFSGLPTVELARVMRDVVIPRADLRGVYHVSADPISKYDLLCLIARIYELSIDIEPDSELAIDRSLDSSRFRQLTGYAAPAWPVLIRAMRDFG